MANSATAVAAQITFLLADFGSVAMVNLDQTAKMLTRLILLQTSQVRVPYPRFKTYLIPALIRDWILFLFSLFVAGTLGRGSPCRHRLYQNYVTCDAENSTNQDAFP